MTLETRSPLERAIFVLREAFGLSYAEIGAIIGRHEATVRQLARRAREHVAEGRTRFDANQATRQRVTLARRDVTFEGGGYVNVCERTFR